MNIIKKIAAPFSLIAFAIMLGGRRGDEPTTGEESGSRSWARRMMRSAVA